MAKEVVTRSDISGELMLGDDQVARAIVHEHPKVNPEEGVPLLEVAPDELKDLSKLAVKDLVHLEVEWPADKEGDEPKVETYFLTAANFAKLSGERPMDDVLEKAARISRKKKLGAGATAAAAGGERIDYTTVEFAGSPKKGKTSPAEQATVQGNFDQVNENLKARGQRMLDLANKEHVERYNLWDLAKERGIEPK